MDPRHPQWNGRFGPHGLDLGDNGLPRGHGFTPPTHPPFPSFQRIVQGRGVDHQHPPPPPPPPGLQRADPISLSHSEHASSVLSNQHNIVLAANITAQSLQLSKPQTNLRQQEHRNGTLKSK
jgi:hypothetical protein